MKVSEKNSNENLKTYISHQGLNKNFENREDFSGTFCLCLSQTYPSIYNLISPLYVPSLFSLSSSHSLCLSLTHTQSYNFFRRTPENSPVLLSSHTRLIHSSNPLSPSRSPFFAPLSGKTKAGLICVTADGEEKQHLLA